MVPPPVPVVLAVFLKAANLFDSLRGKMVEWGRQYHIQVGPSSRPSSPNHSVVAPPPPLVALRVAELVQDPWNWVNNQWTTCVTHIAKLRARLLALIDSRDTSARDALTASSVVNAVARQMPVTPVLQILVEQALLVAKEAAVCELDVSRAQESLSLYRMAYYVLDQVYVDLKPSDPTAEADRAALADFKERIFARKEPIAARSGKI